jgi:hypothetical protein
MILGSTWVSSNQVINPAAVLPLWQENRASRDALMKASVSNTSKLPLLQLVVVVRLPFGALPALCASLLLLSLDCSDDVLQDC